MKHTYIVLLCQLVLAIAAFQYFEKGGGGYMSHGGTYYGCPYPFLTHLYTNPGFAPKHVVRDEYMMPNGEFEFHYFWASVDLLIFAGVILLAWKTFNHFKRKDVYWSRWALLTNLILFASLFVVNVFFGLIQRVSIDQNGENYFFSGGWPIPQGMLYRAQATDEISHIGFYYGLDAFNLLIVILLPIMAGILVHKLTQRKVEQTPEPSG